MRAQYFHRITMLGLFLTLAVASVNAQSRTKIEATIPFDFSVGETNLQAGKYSVRFTSQNVLLLRRDDGKNSAIVIAPRAIEGDKGKTERMVFYRYGDRYFLAQVWMLRTGTGRELDTSKTERDLAKKLGKSLEKPKAVEVVAVAR